MLPGGFSSVQEMMAAQRKRDENLRQLFDWIDEDSSGTIELSEFMKTCHQLNITKTMNESEIKEHWNMIDSDSSGNIDFNEFKKLMTAHFGFTIHF